MKILSDCYSPSKSSTCRLSPMSIARPLIFPSCRDCLHRLPPHVPSKSGNAGLLLFESRFGNLPPRQASWGRTFCDTLLFEEPSMKRLTLIAKFPLGPDSRFQARCELRFQPRKENFLQLYVRCPPSTTSFAQMCPNPFRQQAAKLSNDQSACDPLEKDGCLKLPLLVGGNPISNEFSQNRMGKYFFRFFFFRRVACFLCSSFLR